MSLTYCFQFGDSAFRFPGESCGTPEKSEATEMAVSAPLVLAIVWIAL